MNRKTIILGFIIIGFVVFITGSPHFRPSAAVLGPAGQTKIPAVAALHAFSDFGKTPLYFVPNRGQADARALFYAKTPAYTLWIAPEGIVFDSTRRREKAGPLPSGQTYERDVSRIRFLQANPSPEVIGLEPTEYRVNYFVGKETGKWRPDIRTSAAVLYKDIYPDIDLKIYGVENRVEYDWLVGPGGTAEEIRFVYQNVETTRLDRDGNLVVRTKFGELTHQKPVGYQDIGGERVDVQAKFKRIEGQTYGFEVESYDRRYPLTIDPVVLVYSSYLGGSDRDESYDIAVDNLGSAYVVGATVSPDFPVKNAYDSIWNTNVDIFITKFSASGQTLVYSTFLGGNGSDNGRSIAVDAGGAAYVTGYTFYSPDFPVLNAYDPTLNGAEDAFVTKLSPAGNALLYSTFLGGAAYDSGLGIAVDRSGSAYVIGTTRSSDFPVLNGYDSTLHGQTSDVFITKFSPTGNSLEYSTFLGGSESDMGSGIAVDADNAAYVIGTTYSADFPMQNPYNRTIGGGYQLMGYYMYDAFVAKLDPSGRSLIFSTFLGGTRSDMGVAIAVDNARSVYVTGDTNSSDFPMADAFDPTWNGHYVGHGGYTSDVFVTKFSPSGNAIVYSTYLGGAESSNDVTDIAVDGAGAALVTGETASSDFPVLNGLNLNLGTGWNVFITKFTPGGKTLNFSTLLGGTNDDTRPHAALDSAGSVYVTGNTSSADFPVRNAYDSIPNNIFVTKMSFIPLYPPLNFRLQRLENKYIFYKEYVNRLSWAVNPQNQVTIVKYRIYRKTKGAADSAYQWLADVSSSGMSFFYNDRSLPKTAVFSYRISSLDDSGNESHFLEVSN
ncbi:MAG: SBBP repeat-containing protein [Candidatus Aminicenantes bacterium]|nr:SBBP repeat-containing protein [Candidatus Aminicenantes bacterium]